MTRNIYAHHSRLWNRPSVTQPYRPSASAVPNWPISPLTYTLRRVIMLRQ
ncbi:hypothetical protein [Mesorhizobium captivum]